MDLSDITLRTYDEINQKNSKKENTYGIISDFGDSSVATDEKLDIKCFRTFTPVKTEKGRKLNPLYGTSFNPFKDTLMDYPTIIQYKLGEVGKSSWKKYNRLISVHIAKCPLNCWHCYIEECLKNDCSQCSIEKCDREERARLKVVSNHVTADKLFKNFITQRDNDKKRGIETNVLRLTGGEPFLAINLMFELLQKIEDKKLNKEIFLWTETNLVPLITNRGKEPLISDDDLKKFKKFIFCRK